ncbi:hypothetical protein FSP39_014184 [Pinctada imbricata]|uniref:Uncharacterized protein n=1 Tax=Pinctada imbricata TaxID=66713 RepID=A0AA88Y6X8_PINIB|nr:hypothetical protein FSP39_014184 [Pinctada imbricata]
MGTTLTKLWILVILGILTCEVQGCKWHQNSKISEGQGMLPMANLIDDRRLEVYPDIPFSRINVITDVPQLKTRSAKSKRSLVFRFPKRNSMNTFRNVRSFKDLKPIKPLENVSSTPLKKIETTPHSEVKNESVIRIEKPGGIDKDTTTFVNKDERGVTLIGRSTLPQQTTAQNKFIEKELTTTIKPESTSVELIRETKTQKGDILNQKIDVKEILKSSMKQTTAIRPSLSSKFQFKGNNLSTVKHKTTSVEQKSQRKIPKKVEKNIGYHKKDVNQIIKLSQKQTTAFKPTSDRFHFTKDIHKELSTTVTDKQLQSKRRVKQTQRSLRRTMVIRRKIYLLLHLTLLLANQRAKQEQKSLRELVDNRKINLRQSFISSKKQKLAFIPLSRRFKFIEKELTTTIAPDTTTVERKSETKTRQHEQLADQPDLDVEKILQSSQKQTTVFRPFSRRFQNFQARNAASFTFSRKPKKIQVKQREVQDEDISFKLLKLLSNTTIKLSTTMSPYASKSEPQIQATSISTTPVPVELTTHDTTLSVASKEPINYPTLNVISKLNYLQQQLNKIKNQKKQESQKSATKGQPVKQPSVVKRQPVENKLKIMLEKRTYFIKAVILKQCKPS